MRPMFKIALLVMCVFILFSLAASAEEGQVDLHYKVRELLKAGKKYHLILLGKDAVKYLESHIRSGGVMTRMTAVSALGGIGDPSAQEILKELIHRMGKKKKLQSVEEKLVIYSAEALVNCGSDEGLSILEDTLKGPDPAIVEQSAAALSRVGHLSSAFKIIECVRRLDPKVKNLFSALKLLYHRHKPDWQKDMELKTSLKEMLLLCIGSDKPGYRFSAAWLAGEIGERSLIPELKGLLGDKDSQVMNQAAHSLCYLGDIAGLEISLKNLNGSGVFQDESMKKELRREAARCLCNIRTRGVEAELLKVLRESDEVLVNNAIVSIYLIGNTRIVGSLEEVMKEMPTESSSRRLLEKAVKEFRTQNSYIQKGPDNKNVEYISIRGRDTEVWRLFKMITKITGKRIVVNPGVEGVITYSAREKHYLDVIRQITTKMGFRVKISEDMIEVFKD